jgi:hypothetical protein
MNINLLKGQSFIGQRVPDTSVPLDDSFLIIGNAGQVSVWLPKTTTCLAHDALDLESDIILPGEQCMIVCVDYTEGPPSTEGESSGNVYRLYRLPKTPTKSTDETKDHIPAHASDTVTSPVLRDSGEVPNQPGPGTDIPTTG